MIASWNFQVKVFAWTLRCWRRQETISNLLCYRIVGQVNTESHCSILLLQHLLLQSTALCKCIYSFAEKLRRLDLCLRGVREWCVSTVSMVRCGAGMTMLVECCRHCDVSRADIMAGSDADSQLSQNMEWENNRVSEKRMEQCRAWELLL